MPLYLLVIIVAESLAVIGVLVGVWVLIHDVQASRYDTQSEPARAARLAKSRIAAKAQPTASVSRAKPQAATVTPSVSAQSHRGPLIAAIAATVGIMIGSVSPWLTVVVVTINGLDLGQWGVAALVLGALSGVALLVESFWERTPFAQRGAVPVAWAVAVVGAAGVSFTLPFVVKVLTIPTQSYGDFAVGAGVGWGLWLIVVSSVALCVTASVVATQLSRPDEGSPSTWSTRWRWAAIGASAVIALSAIVYFSTHWDGSLGSAGHSTEIPSFPNIPSP